MLHEINGYLEHWYPLYWSIIFIIEMLLGIATLSILVIEYYYDKEVEESKSHKRRKSKRVKIVIDDDGQAVIMEQPKGLDVSIEHKGTRND